MIQSNDLYTEDRIYNVFDSEALTHIDHMSETKRLPARLQQNRRPSGTRHVESRVGFDCCPMAVFLFNRVA